MQETQDWPQVQSLGQEDPQEKGMAMHSSILDWRIPWTEEPGGPQSMGHKEQTWLSNWTDEYVSNKWILTQLKTKINFMGQVPSTLKKSKVRK